MTKAIFIAVLLSLAGFTKADAQDDARNNQLAKEIQDLKIRVSKLESVMDGPSQDRKVESSSEGWKSIANWRKLSAGMSGSEVRKVLGDPRRINAGISTTWYYEDQGRVDFLQGEVFGWSEPEK